jgi:hypothetical protein
VVAPCAAHSGAGRRDRRGARPGGPLLGPGRRRRAWRRVGRPPARHGCVGPSYPLTCICALRRLAGCGWCCWAPVWRWRCGSAAVTTPKPSAPPCGPARPGPRGVVAVSASLTLRACGGCVFAGTRSACSGPCHTLAWGTAGTATGGFIWSSSSCRGSLSMAFTVTDIALPPQRPLVARRRMRWEVRRRRRAGAVGVVGCGHAVGRTMTAVVGAAHPRPPLQWLRLRRPPVPRTRRTICGRTLPLPSARPFQTVTCVCVCVCCMSSAAAAPQPCSGVYSETQRLALPSPCATSSCCLAPAGSSRVRCRRVT